MTSSVVASNLIWRLLERCGAQGVNFLVSIVLARMLSPNEYGIIALVTVFIGVFQVFVDSGLGNALIQKKDADNIDFSSVFYFNIFVCILIYGVIFVAAPFLSTLYDDTLLISIIRVLGLTVIVSGIKNIQQAYIAKHMMFRKFFFSTFCGTIISAILGIVFALLHFGVWALVIQQLSNTIIDTCILWATVEWRPCRKIDVARLKELMGFGWKLLVSSLLETIYNELRSFIIAKAYSSADLAYYNKGNQFPSFVVSNVNSAIDSVLLPSMSEAQDRKDKLKSIVRRSIKTSSFIIWPIMMGLGVCAKKIVVILLTEKWILSVPFMQILCVNYAFWPIHTANLNAIKAVGRSELFLKLEVIKKLIGIISIVVSIRFGVLAIAIAFSITAPIFACINAFPNKLLLGYSILEQTKDIFPSLLGTLIMGEVVWLIGNLLPFSTILILCIQIICGIFVYITVAICFKNDSFYYILDLLKTNIRKR